MTSKFLPYSLLISFLGLALAAGAWLWALPVADDIAAQSACLHRLDETYAAAALRRPQGGDKASAAALTERVNALLPSEDLQYDLIIQLEAMGKSSGLPVSGISVIPQATGAAASGPASKVAVSLSVSGTYDEIQAFIERMLGVNRFMTIDQVSLSGGSQDGSGATLTAQILASAYFIPGTAK